MPHLAISQSRWGSVWDRFLARVKGPEGQRAHTRAKRETHLYTLVFTRAHCRFSMLWYGNPLFCVVLVVKLIVILSSGNRVDKRWNETSFNLEAYHTEVNIWDPTHEHHKYKRKPHDAWCRLSTDLNRPVKELKKKWVFRKNVILNFPFLLNHKPFKQSLAFT